MSAFTRSVGRAAALCGIAAWLSLAACASQPPVNVTGLTAAEIFQQAQDAEDQGNYARAMQYYEQFQQAYPDDKDHGIWARYEIAFLYHKMGQNEKSLSLFNDLLSYYASNNQDGSLPPAPQVLAEKLKVELEKILKKKL